MGRVRVRSQARSSIVLGSYKYKIGIADEQTSDVFGYSNSLEERCVDEIHPNHPKSGGPLSLSRKKISFSNGNGWQGLKTSGRVFVPYQGWIETDVWNIYEGDYQVNLGSSSASIQPLPPDESSTCASYGAEAWNRFKPATPDVGLAQFFAELSHARGFIFERLKKFRALGSDYLAYEFGWKPFLRDVRAFIASIQEIDSKIAQLQSDNGRWIRRGGSLRTNPSEPDYTTSHDNIFVPVMSGKDFQWSKLTTHTENVWFSGQFRYYVPGLLNQKWGRARAITELYDLKITPELVYELIPWSWLVDWFSNLGSVISNLQSSIDDHLVAKYAYVMRSSVQEQTITAHGMVKQTVGSKEYYNPIAASATIRHETKARVAADPFGFSASLPNLTNWQTSILAALGLSRSKV